MTEVTRILNAIEQGDAQAAEQLLPLVYDELRRLAAQKLSHEKPGQTLQATAWCTRRISGWSGSRRPGLGQPGALFHGGGRGDAADIGGECPTEGDAQARRQPSRVDLDAVDIRIRTCHSRAN